MCIFWMIVWNSIIRTIIAHYNSETIVYHRVESWQPAKTGDYNGTVADIISKVWHTRRLVFPRWHGLNNGVPGARVAQNRTNERM